MRAIKVFELTPSHACLTSPMMRTPWYGPTLSVPSDPAGIRPAVHGIHAYRCSNGLADGIAEVVDRPIALALMECEGECVVGTRGIVAQSATIRHIWVPLGTPLRLRALLRQRYGCRVTRTRRLPWWPPDHTDWGLYVAQQYEPPYMPQLLRKALVPYHSPIAISWRDRLRDGIWARTKCLQAKHFTKWLQIHNSVMYRSSRQTVLSEWLERKARHQDVRGRSIEEVRRALDGFLRSELIEPPYHDAPYWSSVVDAVLSFAAKGWTGVQITPYWGRVRCHKRDVGCVICTRDGDTLQISVRYGSLKYTRDEGRFRERIVRYLYGDQWAQAYRTGCYPGPVDDCTRFRLVRHSDGSVTLVTHPYYENRRGVRLGIL